MFIALALPVLGQELPSADVKVAPPQAYPLEASRMINVRGGLSYTDGNLFNRNISGGFDSKFTVADKQNLFVSADAAYGRMNNTIYAERWRGSLLYAYNFHKNLNLFLTSTQAQNRFWNLRYRTANGVGICYDGFADKKIFDPILVSFAITPEYAHYGDQYDEHDLRGVLRFNTVAKFNENVSSGLDFMYFPVMNSISDFRIYGEFFVQFKVIQDKLAFRVALVDEYDSTPRPGIKSNDFYAMESLVFKL